MHGCFTEREHHFTETFGESFACTDVEGHPLPAPVVDEELHRHIGFGGAVRFNSRFLAIPRKRVGLSSPRTVLPANAAVPGLKFVREMGCLQHLGFFIADRFRIEPSWRLHRCDGQHLGEMVLHHVP